MKKLIYPFIITAALIFAGCDVKNVSLKNTDSPLALTGTEVEKSIANNYVLIFDDSGSMNDSDATGERKFDSAKRAVNNFLNSLSKEDNIYLLTLNHGYVKGLEQSKRLLSKVPSDGGTPLTEALSMSLHLLNKEVDKNKGYGTYTIISITDGESNTDTSYIIKKIFNYTKADIVLKTIGFNMSTNNPLNSNLVDYYSADDSEGLKKVLLSIKAEAESFSDDSVNFEN